MDPKSLPSSIDPSGAVRVPAKVFIAGEYQALLGAPALLGVFGPSFEAKLTSELGESLCSATSLGEVNALSEPPQSPLGRLFSWARSRGVEIPEFSWVDPWGGQGGLGESTAKWIAAYLAMTPRLGFEPSDPAAAWKLYRELHQDRDVQPSGADLVAQIRGMGSDCIEGGVVFWAPETRAIRFWNWKALPAEIWVARATSQVGRKVRTHEHLAELGGGSGLSAHAAPMAEAFSVLMEAVERGDAARFGKTLSAYGDVLASLGWECQATRSDRDALASMPGVLGVKGSGAMQADCLVLAVMRGIPAGKREALLEKLRGLELEVVLGGAE